MAFFSNWYEEQYPAVSGQRCVKIYIPDDDAFMPVLAALLKLPANQSNYQNIDDVHAEGIAELWLDAYVRTDWNGCSTPPEGGNMSTNIILFPDRASVTSGATPAWTSAGTSSLGGYWQATPALTGDSYRWDFFLAAGRYNLDLIFLRTTANGKADIEVYDDSSNLLYTLSVDLRGAAQSNTVLGGAFDLPAGQRIRVVFKGTGTSGATFFRPVQRIMIAKYAEL